MELLTDLLREGTFFVRLFLPHHLLKFSQKIVFSLFIDQILHNNY